MKLNLMASKDITAFMLDLSMSQSVPGAVFAGSEGVMMSDRGGVPILSGTRQDLLLVEVIISNMVMLVISPASTGNHWNNKKKDKPISTKVTKSDRPACIHVCFRILGEELDPVQITALLGISPTRYWLSNDLRMVLEEEEPPVSENGWVLSSQGFVKSCSLDDHIQWLLEKLNQHHTAWKQIIDPRLRTEFVVYCVAASNSTSNMSLTISNRTFKDLAKYDSPLIFDMWATPGVAPL